MFRPCHGSCNVQCRRLCSLLLHLSQVRTRLRKLLAASVTGGEEFNQLNKRVKAFDAALDLQEGRIKRMISLIRHTTGIQAIAPGC